MSAKHVRRNPTPPPPQPPSSSARRHACKLAKFKFKCSRHIGRRRAWQPFWRRRRPVRCNGAPIRPTRPHGAQAVCRREFITAARRTFGRAAGLRSAEADKRLRRRRRRRRRTRVQVDLACARRACCASPRGGGLTVTGCASVRPARRLNPTRTLVASAEARVAAAVVCVGQVGGNGSLRCRKPPTPRCRIAANAAQWRQRAKNSRCRRRRW